MQCGADGLLVASCPQEFLTAVGCHLETCCTQVVLELATQPSTFSALAPCLPNFFSLHLKGQGPAPSENSAHDLWLQPAPPLLQPRILRHLEGTLPWISTLTDLSLESMLDLTPARLQQVVGGLGALKTLRLSGPAPQLHCLRLHSNSLQEARLYGLASLLTW